MVSLSFFHPSALSIVCCVLNSNEIGYSNTLWTAISHCVNRYTQTSSNLQNEKKWLLIMRPGIQSIIYIKNVGEKWKVQFQCIYIIWHDEIAAQPWIGIGEQQKTASNISITNASKWCHDRYNKNIRQHFRRNSKINPLLAWFGWLSHKHFTFIVCPSNIINDVWTFTVDMLH